MSPLFLRISIFIPGKPSKQSGALNKFFFVKYMVLLLLLCSKQPGIAQQKDSIKVHSLEEVVIRAERISYEIIPVQTLSGEMLKKLNAYSVADAIRYFAGVQIKDYGGIGGLKTVNIRSLGSQHVGVFYDGIELGNAQNGVVDLGRFSLDNMSAVSLHNGQKSAIFQPAKDFASAGSIYMTTRLPEFAPDKNDNLRASLKTGSFGVINPSLLWEHKINEQLSASFNTEYLYTTGRYKFSYSKKDGYDTTETRKNGDVSSLRVEGSLFGKLKDGDWKTKLYWYRSERGYPGAAVREEPGRFTHQDRQWDNAFFVQSSFKKSFTDFYSLLLNAKYAYDYLHYVSDPRLDVTTMYVDNRYRQQELYLSSAHLFSILPNWSVNVSGDFLYNCLNADLVDFVYPRRYTGLAAVASSLSLNKIKLQSSLLGTFVRHTTKVENGAASNRQEYTPSFMASFKPFEKQDINLRAFYKRIFRMPTLNDLYYTFIGNKNLDPEYASQYDVGVTYARNFPKGIWRNVEAQVDFYFNQVKNKIIAMPASNQFRWTMINLGYTEIRGMDISAQSGWQVSDSLLLNTRLSYTYQKAQDFTNKSDPYYGGQIPYIPWHSGSFVLNSSYRSWNLQYSFIYTGERYEAVANIPENYSRPWYTHDIALGKNWKVYKKALKSTVELNNLLNQQYEVVQWYPMPGINYKIILQLDI